ncbi:hypothetical protein GCM10020229_77270 [Kitasatospora albolonga]|uniref:hypothetical protein n=1 Tax=Kitasatospora albolonga TaxID=68173 RepID=UPI0031E9771B
MADAVGTGSGVVTAGAPQEIRSAGRDWVAFHPAATGAGAGFAATAGDGVGGSGRTGGATASAANGAITKDAPPEVSSKNTGPVSSARTGGAPPAKAPPKPGAGAGEGEGRTGGGGAAAARLAGRWATPRGGARCSPATGAGRLVPGTQEAPPQ